jgi:hypothetical protein
MPRAPTEAEQAESAHRQISGAPQRIEALVVANRPLAFSTARSSRSRHTFTMDSLRARLAHEG